MYRSAVLLIAAITVFGAASAKALDWEPVDQGLTPMIVDRNTAPAVIVQPPPPAVISAPGAPGRAAAPVQPVIVPQTGPMLAPPNRKFTCQRVWRCDQTVCEWRRGCWGVYGYVEGPYFTEALARRQMEAQGVLPPRAAPRVKRKTAAKKSKVECSATTGTRVAQASCPPAVH